MKAESVNAKSGIWFGLNAPNLAAKSPSCKNHDRRIFILRAREAAECSILTGRNNFTSCERLGVISSSMREAIRFIVSIHSWNFPVVVSPLSIIQSAPSLTALATSSPLGWGPDSRSLIRACGGDYYWFPQQDKHPPLFSE